MTHHEITELAKRLRYWSLRMSTQGQSGHPTSSLSAADLAAVLLAHHVHYDVKHPENGQNDRIIFSKGHASPLYYAMYEALGVLDAADVLQYRKLASVLEGHPTPRFAHTLVATGSLGMGLGFGAGMALALAKRQSIGRIWVLLGDGELAEGSVWEAAAFASQHNLTNLVAIVDGNRLGQSGPTAYGHHLGVYAKRFASFGWRTIEIDGHNIEAIDQAMQSARGTKEPLVILAKTVKGKGVSFLEDAEGWHGKALDKQELDRAIDELGVIKTSGHITLEAPKSRMIVPAHHTRTVEHHPITFNEPTSVRAALGQALEHLVEHDPDIRVIDGDVSNSTFTQVVRDEQPDQFIETYIAEQMCIELAVGLQAFGYHPVFATFAAFLTRAFDQIRMASISKANLTLIGTHVGVSIGQDGPSQMGLEDMAMIRAIDGSVVLSPSDAVSATTLLPKLLAHNGIGYIRAVREETSLVYKEDDTFDIGGSKMLRSSKDDSVVVVATGITVHEALEAYGTLQKSGILVRVIDAYSIKPIDRKTLHDAALVSGHFITVEDHRVEGGLGDAVAEAFSDYSGVIPVIHRLAIKEMPRSGKPDQLRDAYGISAKHIVTVVRTLLMKSAK